MPWERFRACPLYASAALILLSITTACQTAPSVAGPKPGPKQRRVEVNLQLRLNAPEHSRQVRVWIPFPVSDENQTIGDVKIEGNYSHYGIHQEEEFGNSILYAEWRGPAKQRVLTYRFQASRREVLKKDFPKQELRLSHAGLETYLRPTSLGPTSGRVKQRADEIVAKTETPLAQARAIYDWIVDNMYRDPEVKGCGYGDVERLLGTLGGKCGDLHSVYVALARSAGIPAREIFGIRIPADPQGDMSKAQHCWAEFYLPGYGWVPIDPSDVRKIILEKKLSLEEERPYREYYFGAVDENRIAYGLGRDLILNPPQAEAPLNYFMYPHAEADGKALNEDLFGFNLGYTITYKNL